MQNSIIGASIITAAIIVAAWMLNHASPFQTCLREFGIQVSPGPTHDQRLMEACLRLTGGAIGRAN